MLPLWWWIACLNRFMPYTVTSLDSAGVAQLFLEHVWHHHRLPEEVISDHGPTFISNFSHDLTTLLGVKLTLWSRSRILVLSFLGTSVLVARLSTLAVLLQF